MGYLVFLNSVEECYNFEFFESDYRYFLSEREQYVDSEVICVKYG